MEYAILKSHSAEELENRVKVYISEGYEPAGGIAVASESTDCRYANLFCQAVIKKDTVDEGPEPPEPIKPDPDPDPNPDRPIEPPEEVIITGDEESTTNLRLFK